MEPCLMKKKYSTVKIEISPYAKRIWRIDCSLLLIAAAVVILFIGIYWPIISVVAGLLLLAVYVVFVVYLIPAYFHMYLCELSQNFILLRNGFFIVRTAQIRYDAIQYCILSQSILQRIFRVCSVNLMLAGSVSIIRQVSLKDGNRIKALIERKISHENQSENRGISHKPKKI